MIRTIPPEPIDTARLAMDILKKHSSMTDEHLKRTTYVAGILESARNGERVVLLSSAGENARGLSEAFMRHMDRELKTRSEGVNVIAVSWVNTVEGGCSEYPAGTRPAGNDAEQQLLRVNDHMEPPLEDESNTREGFADWGDEALWSNRSSDSSYTSATGDWIPQTHVIRRLLAADKSEWISPLLALKTSRPFCEGCTEAIDHDGLEINSDDRTEAVRVG